MNQPGEHDAPPPPLQSPASGSATPAPTPAPADGEALRGTRFEFGGRRPYSFAPPRVTERPAGRPLPGMGTVALGHVSRIVPFGAFVDFLGFRGMIHISQLLPGQRVERVEDVLQLQDQVQVRVIGVDPERRHINLVLVARLAPGDEITGAARAAPAPRGAEAPVGAGSAEIPAPLAPPIAQPPAESAPAPVHAAPVTSPLPPVLPFQPAPHLPPALGAPSSLPPAVTTPPVARTLPRPAAKAASAPASMPDPRTAAQPAVAQHGARAIRRELADPRHPMARLLASAGQARARAVDRDRALPVDELAPPIDRAAHVAPVPPRPVHVFGPDPEPEPEQPATLEALAARFGQRRDAAPSKPTRGAPPNDAAQRSRQEREKQAHILAKLREDSAKFVK